MDNGDRLACFSFPFFESSYRRRVALFSNRVLTGSVLALHYLALKKMGPSAFGSSQIPATGFCAGPNLFGFVTPHLSLLTMALP